MFSCEVFTGRLPSGNPIITVDPEHPSIPNWTPLGAIVATVSITQGGSAYGGTPSLTDPDGIYALIAAPSTGVFYLIIDPNGPGVGPEGGNIDNVTITAN